MRTGLAAGSIWPRCSTPNGVALRRARSVIFPTLVLASLMATACTGVVPQPAPSTAVERSPGVTSPAAGAQRSSPAPSRSAAISPAAISPADFSPADFQPTGTTQLAHVIRVVDGDTIHVLLNGKDERLRYIGMDTPEDVKPGTPVQPMSLEAAAENTRLVADRDVILEKDVSERDRFGRLLRYVWLHEGDRWTMIGMQLVLEGFAQIATFPPDVRYVDLYLAAQRVARDRQLGLWAPATAPTASLPPFVQP
jgi:micrococcal nuclease